MTAMTTPRHAISRATEAIHHQLDTVADASLWSMDPAETAKTLQALTRAAARLAELEARVAGHADTLQVGSETGATSTAHWWATVTRQTKPTTLRKIALARALGSGDHEPVRQGLVAGDLLADQAQVILRAIGKLPDDLDPALAAKAEEHLVAEAAHYDAKALAIMGDRLLEVIAPEIADAHEARLLAREEAAAAAATRLTMTDDGHGIMRGTFAMPSVPGAMLKKLLLGFAAPKHRAATDGHLGERRPTPERMGQALVELIERYPADRAPHAGGLSATALVLIPLDTLMGGLKAAHLDTGEPLSPGLARRIACQAGIIPVVLGGKSEVLDVGRKRRFHTKAMRYAMVARDGGCIVDGCDYPPSLTHAHHNETSWAHGGDTSLTNGCLICPGHHTRAHDPTYRQAKLPNGKITFHRRT